MKNNIGYTIDKMHNDYINKFNKQEKKQNNISNKMSKLENDLKNINKKIIKNNKNIGQEELKNRTKILLEIKELKKELNLIDCHYEELNYFDKSIDILTEYYDILDNKVKTNIPETNINNIFKTKNNEYKSILLNRYIKNNKNINNSINKKRKCNNPLCNNEELTIHISSGYFSCIKCGYSEELIIEGDKTSYRECSNENSIYAYKRINHFNEWLNQFQGKETTEIPDDLFVNLMNELAKQRITNINKINITKMRKILKSLGYNKYYEHIPHILSKIGKKPPKISRNTEEELRIMFKQIQLPFNLYCPDDRKNFLSYSYTLHKFCQLLDLEDLAKLFPMLKSKEKLREQDLLWKKICNHLKWEFIPSI